MINGESFYEKATDDKVDINTKAKAKTYVEVTVAKVKTKTDNNIETPAPAPARKPPGAEATFGLDVGAACKLSKAAEEQAASCTCTCTYNGTYGIPTCEPAHLFMSQGHSGERGMCSV